MTTGNGGIGQAVVDVATSQDARAAASAISGGLKAIALGAEVAKKFNTDRRLKKIAAAHDIMMEALNSKEAVSFLNIDKDGNTYSVQSSDYDISSRSFGEGETATVLRELANIFCVYLKYRANRIFSGDSNDVRSLISYQWIQTCESLSNNRALYISGAGRDLLSKLAHAAGALISQPERLNLASRNDTPTMASTLQDAKPLLKKAIQMSEMEEYNQSSREILERTHTINTAILNRSAPSFFIHSLVGFKVTELDVASIKYTDLDPEKWNKLHDSLLQAVMHRIFGRKKPVGARESGDALNFIKILERPINDSQRTKDSCLVFIENLRKISFAGSRFKAHMAAYKYQNENGDWDTVNIPTGFADDIEKFSNLPELWDKIIDGLKTAYVIRKVKDVQVVASNHAKDYGDIGLYQEARASLDQLLPASISVIEKLGKSIDDVSTMTDDARRDFRGGQSTDTRANHKNSAENYKKDFVGSMRTYTESIRQLQDNALSTAEIPKTAADKLEDEKRLRKETAGVIGLVRSIGIDIPEVTYDDLPTPIEKEVVLPSLLPSFAVVSVNISNPSSPQPQPKIGPIMFNIEQKVSDYSLGDFKNLFENYKYEDIVEKIQAMLNKFIDINETCDSIPYIVVGSLKKYILGALESGDITKNSGMTRSTMETRLRVLNYLFDAIQDFYSDKTDKIDDRQLWNCYQKAQGFLAKKRPSEWSHSSKLLDNMKDAKEKKEVHDERQSENIQLRTDNQALKNEVAQLRTANQSLQNEVAQLNIRMASLAQRMEEFMAANQPPPLPPRPSTGINFFRR